jgi:hypothetical protein
MMMMMIIIIIIIMVVVVTVECKKQLNCSVHALVKFMTASNGGLKNTFRPFLHFSNPKLAT